MNPEFIQQNWLVLLLIILLFGKEYLPAILARFGIKINGQAKQQETDEFRGYIKAKVENIETNISNIYTRLDQHLNDEEQKIDKVHEVELQQDARLAAIESRVRKLE